VEWLFKVQHLMAQPDNDSIPTRPSLIGRLKDVTDQSSWREFNDLYSKVIFGFAIKAGLTRDEAQEVVQETLIAAAKHLPQFRYDPERCSFKTWLLNMSFWRVQNQLRKRNAPSAPRYRASGRRDANEAATRTATVERLADPAGPQLEALWDKEWQTTLLDAASKSVKAQVDSKHWQIFDLYVLKEWSVSEVAKALNVSAGRVYLVKHRVSALLKKEVERLKRQAQDRDP
jgi:RNA polymerase sigma factor (sigma-70 family)